MRWLLILVLASPLWATQIYFAPTSAGSNNGTNCAEAYAYNDGTHGVNVAGNWSAGNIFLALALTEQIGLLKRQHSRPHGPVSEQFMRHHYGASGYVKPAAL